MEPSVLGASWSCTRISLVDNMATAPEDSQGPWQAWANEMNALSAGEQRAASSQVMLKGRNSLRQLERNILEAKGQAPRGTLQTTEELPQHTDVVMPQVGPSASMDTPASAQEQRTTSGTPFGSVMTWALSQGFVWQWQDDAGGWVNMHEDWMPQLTNLKGRRRYDRAAT